MRGIVSVVLRENGKTMRVSLSITKPLSNSVVRWLTKLECEAEAKGVAFSSFLDDRPIDLEMYCFARA